MGGVCYLARRTGRSYCLDIVENFFNAEENHAMRVKSFRDNKSFRVQAAATCPGTWPNRQTGQTGRPVPVPSRSAPASCARSSTASPVAVRAWHGNLPVIVCTPAGLDNLY